ncbi:uncharacterized protein K452DRAFT_313844 [Aplosporella prunicola CBS 121167]|uniref:Uncharacterized protein n=1 Tax=Aplosporella prunicola CBS 121167 TaxID=1176127 RepID=A0A6A6AXF3_9PEZI|nr:uncharacterized protein K452DRAFT_313844 [Aplosporella prunicola CBS 121167]KAF2135624.1 hypothetical protein K452DRAFT_313844 [Aplosporella prunicola CBS 121167]
MIRRLFTLLGLLALISAALAATTLADDLLSFSLSRAAPASFCKCTCFSNSTIIQLNGLSTSPANGYSSSSGSGSSYSSGSGYSLKNVFTQRKSKPTKERTCNDCNRQFCLEKNNLPICKGATEEDVMTTCFQRDSTKDQAVVLIFIISTGSLLVYAAVRPYIERIQERTKERRTYLPVPTQAS